jgi:hypothetical protein
VSIRIEKAKGGYILHGEDNPSTGGKSRQPHIHTTLDSLFMALEKVLTKRGDGEELHEAGR